MKVRQAYEGRVIEARSCSQWHLLRNVPDEPPALEGFRQHARDQPVCVVRAVTQCAFPASIPYRSWRPQNYNRRMNGEA
jgi:hypothetical protein